MTHYKIFRSMLHGPVSEIWIVRENNQERQLTTTLSVNQDEQMSLYCVRCLPILGQQREKEKKK